MKYLLVTNSEEAKTYAELVFESIQRYDVRAEIYIVKDNKIVEIAISSEIPSSYKSIRLKHLKECEPDLVLIIGEDFNRKSPAYVKRLNKLSCFFANHF